jgi:hypothetical protein
LHHRSYQRREANFESRLPPKTTGTTYFDDLQKPASFVLTSKDPSGFSEFVEDEEDKEELKQ